MSSAFNEDHYVQDRVKVLVKKYGVLCAVETGTYHGATTAFLSSLVPTVYTIESREDYLNVAKKGWGGIHNIVPILGDSAVELKSLLERGIASPALFFLDAHWGKNPLRDELTAIAEHAPNSIVLIHDFQVPGTDLGYDEAYPGQPINLDYIEPALPAIYPGGYEIAYNEEAAGSRRGVAYLTPA